MSDALPAQAESLADLTQRECLARIACRHPNPTDREEATAEAVAAAWVTSPGSGPGGRTRQSNSGQKTIQG